MSKAAKSAGASTSAFTIALAYAAVASLWILLSDKVMAGLFSDPEMLVRVSMAKGWLFVAVTTLILYVLVRRLVLQLSAAHQRELDQQRLLQQAHPLLAAIADSSDDAIFAKDQQGRYILFNKAAARIIGKPASAVLGHDDRSLFPPEQAEWIMATDRRVRESGQQETNEETVLTSEGTRTFLGTKGPLRNTDGQIIGTFGISRDITVSKDVERALRDAQVRSSLLIEHAPVALALFDRDMRYLATNRAWLDDFGIANRDVIGQSHYEIFPDLPEVWKAAHRRGLAGEVISSEGEPFHQANGRTVWIRWSVRPWRTAAGDIGGIVIFSENITGRKEAEVAMSASEQRFHDIVDASADWIWEIDTANRYTFASDSVRGLLGYEPAEIIGKTPFDLMPVAEAAQVRPEFEAIAARKAMFRDLDNINLHKDGSIRHVQTNGMPIFAPDGALLGYRGLDRDVTKQKNAEAALQRLADDLKATLQAIPDLLFELDAEGRYITAKTTREELMAAPSVELPGKTVREVLPPEAAQTVMDALAAASRNGSDYGRMITLPLAHGTGHFEISVARKPALADELEHFIVLSRDITARKVAEDELRERNAELERFNKATVGRELDMIDLKARINALSTELGRAPPYRLDYLEDNARKGEQPPANAGPATPAG